MTKRIIIRSGLFTFIIFVVGMSAWHVSRSWWRSAQSEGTVLRFSHWQLEPGVRRAFDEIARDYEALHPDVRIEQLAIPGRSYSQWGRTQLIGGSAPDLMQIGLGVSRGLFFKDFIPITAYVNQPNPYNRDNALADVPWRSTFNDGMVSSFDVKTMECFGASLFSATMRLCSNQELLRKVTGSDDFPANFTELQQLRDTLHQYNQDHGTSIALISSAGYYSVTIFRTFFSTQTQKLASELNPLIDFPLLFEDFYLSYLEGRWTMQDEAIRSAALLLREASTLMAPGYVQAGSDQAQFTFIQGHSLIMVLSSLQATGILENADFPVQINRIPQTQTNNPVFGSYMRGPLAEAPLNSYGAFGITRTSPHKEVALDFLRYLTSQEVCQKFTRISRNLPTVVGVEATESMQNFFPSLKGFPPGPDLLTGYEMRAVFAQQQHLLASPSSTADEFLTALEPSMRTTMRSDLERIVKSREIGIRVLESPIAATERLSRIHPKETPLVGKLSDQLETQNEIEAAAYYTRLRLHRSASK